MYIKEYPKIDKKKWDELVEKSPDGWLYQTSTYIDYASRSGNKSFSFAVFSDAHEMIGLCPLYFGDQFSLSKNIVLKYAQAGFKKFFQPILSFLNLWTYKVFYTGFSGPVISPVLGDKGRKKTLKFIFDHIDQVAQENKAEALEVRLTDLSLSNLPPLRRERNILWEMGIAEQLFYPPRFCIVLDLAKSEETLLSEMDKDCRAEIKQAERNGLKVRKGVGKKDLKLFHQIHIPSWKRTGMHPQAFEHYDQMWKHLGGEKTMALFFAEDNEKPVSAVLLHIYKDGVFYWGGCSLPEALKLKANNFLLWSAVKWAKKAGYKWFEIGLFDSFMGANQKEYTVGRYKAQFSSEYLIPFEAQKIYTKKALGQITKRKKEILKK